MYTPENGPFHNHLHYRIYSLWFSGGNVSKIYLYINPLGLHISAQSSTPHTHTLLLPVSWQANVRLQSCPSVTQVFEKLQSMYENILTLLFDTSIATSMYHLFLGYMDDDDI